MTEVYPFQPTQISGCSLWLDAADKTTVVLSGSTVSQWKDKSGNARNFLQVTQANQPTYINSSKSSLLFNGINSSMASSVSTAFFPNTSAFNIFLVGSPITAGLNNVNPWDNGAFIGDSGGYQSIFIKQTNTAGAYVYDTANTTIQTTQGVRLGATTLFNLSFQTTALNFYINGNTPTTSAAPLALKTVGTLEIGTQFSSNVTINRRLNCNINEVLIFGLLTNNQRQQIEGYLGWKWGLAKSLPITHPYYNSPPFSLAIPISLEPSLPLINYAPPFFTPIQISGCQLWLDASDPNANGAVPANDSIISTWKDKSGSGNHALLYSTYGGPRIQLNGLNSRPLLLFDSTQMLSVNKSLPLGFIFVVGRDTSFGGSMFSAATSYFGSPFQGTFTSYINVVTNSGNNIISATGTSQNVVYLYSASLMGSTATVFINGTQWATGAISGTPNTPSSLFISSDSGVPAASDWAECIFYPSRSLTNTQRQQIEGYLAWKWGLQANLPPNHPYKSVSPINVTAPLSLSLPVSIQNTSPFFSPLNITGCSLWLDGRDVNGNGIQPQNGASVSIWNDKSGNKRNATQTTSSLQPTYANMSIVFPNLKYLNMADAFNMLSSVGKFYSIFVVEKRRSNKVQNFMVAFGGAAGNLGIAFGYNGDTTFSHTSAHIADTNYTVTGYQNTDPTRIWSGGYNGSIRDLVLNGTIVTTTNPYTYAITSWTQPCIGFLPLVNINQYYVGNIYEILFYNSYLGISDRQNIEGYLAWKWGIQNSLPSTHPWVRFPPPPL